MELQFAPNEATLVAQSVDVFAERHGVNAVNVE
jgi:hypothetical protein